MLSAEQLYEGNSKEIVNNNRTALSIFINKLPIHLRTVLCALKPNSLEVALHELSQANLLLNEKQKKNHNSNNNK